MKQLSSENTSVYVYIKEAYHQSKKAILTFIGGLAAIWGVLSSLLGQIEGRYIFAALAFVGIVYAIFKYSYWFWRIKKGRMSVPVFKKRNVILLRDGYPENMEKLFHELSQDELQKFAFVMGIDRTGDLGISTKGGVVYAVFNYLDKCYQCNEQFPSVVAQRQLGDFIKRYPPVDPLNKLAYGTCVEIHLMLSPVGNSDVQSIPCNLIFIANSRKEDPNDKNKSEALNDDKKSNIIIPKVFDYLLSTNKFEGVMMGVMGTNGMRQTYQVIFSQTINQFARVSYKDEQNPLSRLYISIREQDYTKWNMSLSQLGEYVRLCSKYYTL